MELTVKKVKLNSRDIRKIYCDAFPKKDRMAFPLMIAMSKLWNTEFLSFYDGDTAVGMIYLAKNHGLVFIMFLAVDEKIRSKGYGSKILRYIRNRYASRKIIVSIEPCEEAAPDLDVRKKRKQFYLRNGYSETGYRMKLNGTEQEILISGNEFRKAEFLLFFALYSNGTVWPKIWKK